MTTDHGADQGSFGFPALLRARRRAAGLTQAELADRAGVGVRTVRDLERGRAARPQRTTVELLAKALELAGPDRAAFLAAARGAALAEADPPPGRGLPRPPTLIGRDRDIADVARLLATAPGPVSLVGLGGVGKSSLALAVAHHVAGNHPGGLAGVIVTDMSTEADMLTVIASVFGVGRANELGARFAQAPALLLLDAVERGPDAVAGALRWLAGAAPTLHVLTAGRHPIGVPNERVWPVAPLEVPPADTEPDLAVVARYPAADLFLTRLRQVRREPLDPREVSALISLVRRLGGLPLALELAAARGRVLDLNEILARYGDRVLDLGVTPAPRDAVALTLRDAIAASYRLLDPAERYALRRLSVFRNRWSVELAEALLADLTEPGAADPVPLLDRLLELGLVSVRGTGASRFRLVDVVRDFAAEQAALAGEVAAARRRHAVVFAQLAARAAPQLVGADLAATVARLDDVASDLWAALAHAANDDPPTALFLASKLPRWWRFRGRDVPGRQWLRRLLDDPRTADVDPRVRAWAQVGVAQLAFEHGAGRDELPAAEAALATFQRLGHVTGELAARSVLCALFMTTGGYDDARRHSEAVLELASRTGRVRDVAVAQHNLVWHDVRRGDLGAARRRLAVVDRLAAQCGDQRLRALARANLTEVARLGGRYDEAESTGRRAITLLEQLGDPSHRRRVLGTVGLALAQAGRVAEAEETLAELRASASGLTATPPAPGLAAPSPTAPAAPVSPAAGVPDPRLGDDGPCAMIEAHLALRRGDRAAAAEWFLAAARVYATGHDRRDMAEALVGVAASTDDPDARADVLGWLAGECDDSGIVLLPQERALLSDRGRRQGLPGGTPA